jgi:hypothetical protein
MIGQIRVHNVELGIWDSRFLSLSYTASSTNYVFSNTSEIPEDSGDVSL